MSRLIAALTGTALLLALGVALPKWLRVSQREHYGPGRAGAVARIWLTADRRAQALVAAGGVLAAAATVLALVTGDAGWAAGGAVVVATLGALWPPGLRWRGAERPLGWTPRLRRLAGLTLVVLVVVAAVAAVVAATAPAIGAVLTLAAFAAPVLLDAAAAVARPLEATLARKFVVQASRRLAAVGPEVIAITGSYGKTTTKHVLAHLLGRHRTVMASPASYNNLLGLSRAVNEGLSVGTEVFIAEMGTYGIGEIQEMCTVFKPSISCITAIGDVHLERMGSREVITRAKSEILEPAHTAVLCVDYPELAALADRLPLTQRVLRVSGRSREDDATPVDVRVELAGGTLSVTTPTGAVTVPAESVGHPGNIACAVALAIAAGLTLDDLADRLRNLPEVPHRAAVVRQDHGPLLIDDTFNSNPSGARSALRRALAEARGSGGTAWVVTPGMVELGPKQVQENTDFARDVVESGARLVVVGSTNRHALLEGARSAARLPGREDEPVVHAVRSRVAASEHLRGRADAKDVVLYENDLPDHYP